MKETQKSKNSHEASPYVTLTQGKVNFLTSKIVTESRFSIGSLIFIEREDFLFSEYLNCSKGWKRKCDTTGYVVAVR